ncbi:hypothetical protein LZC95_04910 [Pendulispora brunnea]|uniref:Uncharacterized protein n=1 Tax=Pendulispora brunnea TaxID=2905690 RepID=A0ABZ2KBY4_9BACT
MNPALLLVPFALQGTLMAVDEGWFHRRRGLPRWERIGHPLDTLTVALCFGWLVAKRPEDPGALAVYVALAVVSCLFVTKDEVVHKRLCCAAECWLHAVLFVLHPIVFFAAGYAWALGQGAWALKMQLVLVLAFGLYQWIYWGPWNRTDIRSAA